MVPSAEKKKALRLICGRRAGNSEFLGRLRVDEV